MPGSRMGAHGEIPSRFLRDEHNATVGSARVRRADETLVLLLLLTARSLAILLVRVIHLL